jgi:hypothetical protein
MKALIVMVEFGAATNLGHDDSDMSLYIKALDSVNAIHKLVSYEAQKKYFTSVSYEAQKKYFTSV